MSSWVKFSGTDEQIAELETAENGFVVRWKYGKDSSVFYMDTDYEAMYGCGKPTHYWIIPADPLREMKIRQAQTGQPVWVKTKHMTGMTINPYWDIPNAEYSFKPFED